MTGALQSLLPMFVGAPLLLGGILLVVTRHHRLRQGIGMATLLILLGGAIALLVMTADGSVIAEQIALWPGGVAIPFIADAFSSLILTIALLVAAVSYQYLIASREARDPSITSFVLILIGGVAGALLTADLFNLFVFIEVMLLPSYGLLVILSRRGDMAGSRLYVTVNLLASTLFLTGVGLIYAVEGTVNLGELAGAADDPVTAIAAAVCLSAIAVKAAVFPVHGWLARAYRSASPAVAALFSGLHTKVAVYIIYRIVSVVFEGDERWMSAILILAAITLVVGALAGLGEREVRPMLLFQMVSGIGFILVGVTLSTPLGLTAGIAYMVHHMIVMGALLLVASAIEQTYGSGRLDRVSGLRSREPLLTVAFIIAALSLAGLPPFSGFIAKYALVLASADADQMLVAGLLVVVSLLSLMAMMRVWADVFNGKRHTDVERIAAESRLRLERGLFDDDPIDAAAVEAEAEDAVARHDPPKRATTTEEDPHEHRGTRIPTALIVPALLLSAVSVGLGFGGELLLVMSEQAGAALLDTAGYVAAVMGR